MARIRTIKPTFFRHRELFELERTSGLPVRVAFAGLWTVADRAGRFRWRLDELKLDCLPYDAVDFGDVLGALERGRFVCRYEVGDRVFGHIPSWSEHQRPNAREPESTLPDPASACTCAHQPARVERDREGEEGKGIGTEDSLFVIEPSAPDSLVILEFPTEGKPREWRLRRAQVDEWQDAYPSLDIAAECRKALVWVKAKPGRTKSARGMCAFLANWFNRAVDSGRGSYAPAQKPTTTVPADADWFEECKLIHGGTCGGDRMRHHLRKQTDAQKAGVA